MDAAFAWIGQLAGWFGQWFPRFVLLGPTRRALKYRGSFWRGGLRITEHGPGLWWYWPATTQFYDWPVVRQTDNLPTQTMDTKDGRSIVLGGMIVYRVDDLKKLLIENHSAVKTIQDITLTAVQDVCCDLTWEELKRENQRGTLKTKLRNAAQRSLRDVGVTVEKCMLTDLAPTRVYRVIQSTMSDTD